jgi:predicted lipid-binding transport protein (Tim44 family)
MKAAGRNYLLKSKTQTAPAPSIKAPSGPYVCSFFRKMLGPLFGGGIRRRLMVWGLSLFGMALLVFVVAGYSYMARQIRRDAAALQSELALVTAEQIHTFVRRKI